MFNPNISDIFMYPAAVDFLNLKTTGLETLHCSLLCLKLKAFYEVSESRPLLSVCSPESYKTNSQKEEHLLEIAENFQRQYLLLHPDRKPLLLYPVNEYGVRKFVSTTLRPTETGLWELQSWQECSSLVADFLSLQLLEPPTLLFSPTAVLRSQKATSFESSTLLCSLLLGLNYDAYVVSGYAAREMCLLDLSLQQCPLLDTKAKGETSDQTQKKYGVKCPMELTSRFLLDQEKKKLEAQDAAILEKELQEQEASIHLPDPLNGFRVHCWVLVLSGRRSIEENFFIDPLTGCSYPTVHDSFQGIESLWNPFNYYVNRQICHAGCKDINFDLENSTQWEPVLHDGVSQQQLIQAVHRRMEKFFLMRSWVSRIGITRKGETTRFPGGKKVTRYRKAMLERFSSTVTNDGLISRLTTYQDLSCTKVARVKEWYKYRSDGLEEREFNQLENSTTERFKSGRAFDLLCKSTAKRSNQEELTGCNWLLVDMAEEPPGPLSWYRLVKYLISEEEKIALQIKASLVEVTTGSHQIFYPSGFLC
uniref:Dynein regulatory complex subunit 7 MORN domain-containing protein n=1 Tax=Xiphophorus couchianus TaxID=32473 RepID=A0A3B5MRT8_9TELE